MHDIQDIRSRVLGGANMSAQQLVDSHGIMLGSTSTGGAFILTNSSQRLNELTLTTWS